MDQQTARALLEDLSAQYKAIDEQKEAIRTRLSEAIVEVLMTKALGPSEVTRLVPFERQHVGRIAKAAGVPPLRERTVVSAKKGQE
jgi:hypothetical protein